MMFLLKCYCAVVSFTSFASTLNSFMLKSIILAPLSWVPYTLSTDDLDSIKNINKLRTPILFITGDSDWIVSANNSQELYAKTDSKKMLWIVQGAGHVQSFENTELRVEFLNLLELKTFKKTYHIFNKE